MVLGGFMRLNDLDCKALRVSIRNPLEGNKKKPNQKVRFGFKEKLAATYSRGIYKTTTIGKTVFDGRVRNGNGSGHSFMATKK